MQTKHILIGLAALLLLRRAPPPPMPLPNIGQIQRNQDPTNWGLNMWARLNGIDLSINGQNPAPGGLDAYGMANEMNTYT